MGLCIGASLMSFVELIDLSLNVLFILSCGKTNRVNVKEEAVSEESERDVRLNKLESQINDWISKDQYHFCVGKIEVLEAQLAAINEQMRSLSRV